ncbi:hypothetical protein FD04_GL001337 [Secundilactobacillus odoratitofui DSM 19909 = JCM 15043]|uniref:Uncharacterized protein n=1 Tax=Secundilactobacillus odoratitofui DSM 19909 = JCM 15043 TaxID=1423776 RepID=A0A0R1LXZ2_9LACO|nr:phage portal protein [Secundilactobacillus odoratitofui]KRK97322.1 hypothetical protein FD04_GL001337 [Secundilactobacillus odoratitofui DSM 19909 = JCM 15043]
MDRALRQLFKIVFAYNNWSGEVTDLTFDHKQSIPHNVSEEATIVATLNGQVSDPTKLSYLSGIDDPQKEVDRLHEQQEHDQQTTANVVQSYLTDQQKGGVANATDDSAAKATDESTDSAGQPNGQENR